ncbi:acyl-CoA thioesterase [Profundibacterium mesophilum]|uniref:Thioesterase n=1 Tax=Profundibacterium mesophilum KAUST100406-0324 TaxID=1037889 RepID=A0A921TCS3_9RHOB|nr:thioesterase family protein [Profundibacterium mesophilum]KAF0676018.1 putative thioesterase [Profundibacterium mesophilum KAUST100406-0324]
MRADPGRLGDYRAHRLLGTRWGDNDVYGHMNNTVHYTLFDTAVNAHLIEGGVLDPHEGACVFLVVETGCRYFSELAFPRPVTAGLRVATLGTSSVRYEIGLFGMEETAAAEGHFVHVNVDRETRRPVPIEPRTRAMLEALRPEGGDG